MQCSRSVHAAFTAPHHACGFDLWDLTLLEHTLLAVGVLFGHIALFFSHAHGLRTWVYS